MTFTLHPDERQRVLLASRLVRQPGGDDLGFAAAYTLLGRLAAAVAVLVVAGIVYSCNDDSNLSDCSERNKPQYRDERGNWTCKDR